MHVLYFLPENPNVFVKFDNIAAAAKQTGRAELIVLDMTISKVCGAVFSPIFCVLGKVCCNLCVSTRIKNIAKLQNCHK